MTDKPVDDLTLDDFDEEPQDELATQEDIGLEEPEPEPEQQAREDARIKQLQKELEQQRQFNAQIAEKLNSIEHHGGDVDEDVDAAIHAAHKRHKEAFDDGDEEAARKAIDEIADLNLKKSQPKQRPQPIQPPPSALPEAELEWQQRNKWWDDPREERAKRVAVNVYQDLIDEGMDTHDPEFYAELDNRLYAAVPRLANDRNAPRQRPRSPVGVSSRGVGRSNDSPRITREAMGMLRDLGLNPNQKEVRQSYLRYGRASR